MKNHKTSLKKTPRRKNYSLLSTYTVKRTLSSRAASFASMASRVLARPSEACVTASAVTRPYDRPVLFFISKPGITGAEAALEFKWIASSFAMDPASCLTCRHARGDGLFYLLLFPYCQQYTSSLLCIHIGNTGAVMHVISREPFDIAARQFPNQALALDDLYRTLKRDKFTSPDDLKQTFPSLDRMKYREKWWVIDIGGGNLRVMFFADFERGKIFIKHISTHAEYDKLTDYYRRNKE